MSKILLKQAREACTDKIQLDTVIFIENIIFKNKFHIAKVKDFSINKELVFALRASLKQIADEQNDGVIIANETRKNEHNQNILNKINILVDLMEALEIEAQNIDYTCYVNILEYTACEAYQANLRIGQKKGSGLLSENVENILQEYAKFGDNWEKIKKYIN